MRKSALLASVAILLALVAGAWAEERFALVVGNGTYTHLGRLVNPENDARDVAAALRGLGFRVDLLVNSDLSSMEDAVVRLGDRLSSPEAVGFFYYAGHGVQSNGANYLIPTDANIPSASFLAQKALALQSVLDTLQASGNKLNIVVLDACRDNPFSWSRSGTRGLAVVGAQPPGSIIVYATGAGSVARDGDGRNGTFTGEMLKRLVSPGTDVFEVFKETGAAVAADTDGLQIPAIYSQYFGSYSLAAGSASAASGVAEKGPDSAKEATVRLFQLAKTGTAADIQAALRDGAEVNAEDPATQQTPLNYAARYNPNLEVTESLINAGADLEPHDSNYTPLVWAAMSNPNPEITRALVMAGANLNVKITGRSLLCLAAMYTASPEVISILLDAGADPKFWDDYWHKTPLDYARENKSLIGTEAFRRLEKATR